MRGLVPGWARAAYRSFRIRCLSLGLEACRDFSLSEEERNASSNMAIVIAVHDSPDVTHRCLESLKRFGGESEIILVDDGSKSETTQRLLDLASVQNGWRLIKHQSPLGHSRASEVGVAVSTRPYVCLLNSDTIVTPCSWLGVARVFDLSSKIAVVGPSTSHTVTAQVVPQARYCRHYWSDEQIWCFAMKYVSKHQHEPVIDLPRAGGFAFFIRRTIWDKMGGFDKQLADYGNETELCTRLKNHNYRVVWTKASYIHHLGSESYGRTLGLAEIKRRGTNADSYIRRTQG